MTELKEQKVSTSRNPNGRTPIPLDEKQIQELAKILCTNKEIAAVMGVSEDTIERRYAGKIKEWKEEGRSSLRRYMWQAAKKGNVSMQIWLSKQILGMREPEPEVREQHRPLLHQLLQEIATPKDNVIGKTNKIDK